MKRVLAGLAALALVRTAAAQEPPAATFRASTELVRLDVRATDATGRPVGDLKAEDLEVLDRGQRRPIVLFQHVVESPRTFEDAALETVGGEASTNIGAPRGHFYALVFDQLHITAGREQRVRNAAARFINTRLKPGDRVAIFSLPGPGAALPFTSDLDKARAALDRVGGRANGGGRGDTSAEGIRTFEAYEILRGDDNTANKVLARLPGDPAYAGLAGSLAASTIAGGTSQSDELTIIREEASRIVGQADMESRTFLTLLSDVMKSMRTIEGRKSVIVFSEGFFIDRMARDLDTVAAAAAASYSVVYGIDLNGFDGGADQERPQFEGQLAEVTERRDPLATLALETNGRLVANATNFDQVLDNIADEASDYYLVGFEPASGDRGKEGDYRRVKVNIRRNGLQVRARTGYAVPEEANPASRRRGIDQALESPFAVTALPVEYTTYLFHSPTPGRQRVIVSLTTSLPWTGDPNRTADVVFVARDARTGATAASGTDHLKLPGPGSSQHDGLTVPYRVQFEVPAGEYVMRVIVREPGGLVGTADRRFRVPPLEGPGITASDLVIAVGDSAALAPPTRARAQRDERLMAYLELYGPRSALEQAQPTIEVARRDQETLASVQPLITESAQGGRILRARLPVDGLPAGSYIARVRVPSPQGPAILVTRGFEVVSTATVPVTSGPSFDARAFLTQPDVREYVERARRTTDETGNALTLTRRGLDELEEGDYANAASTFEVIGRLSPSDAWAPFFLGASYAANGRERDAIGAWREAAVLDPRRPDIHLYLADAYLRLRQTALAVQVLESGLVALPDAVELKTRLAAIKH